MANKIYVNNIIEKTGGGAVVAGSNVSYTVPSNSSANIGSVDNIKDAIDWILINWTSSTVPTIKTLSSISWTGGSINPTSVTSGRTVTLTKGTITANYSDGTTANVTSSTSFIVNNSASINGTTITAPTVTTNTTVTVTAQYTENGVSKTATRTLSFSVVPQSTITYYWYVGHENPMSISSISALTSNDATAGPGWRTIGASLPTYTKTNPLWNNIYGTIVTATQKSTQYMALPSSDIKSRNDITGEDITSDGWNNIGTKTLNNVTYTVYSSVNTKNSFIDTLY